MCLSDKTSYEREAKEAAGFIFLNPARNFAH